MDASVLRNVADIIEKNHQDSKERNFGFSLFDKSVLTGCPLGPGSPCLPGSPIPPIKPLLPCEPLWPGRPLSPWKAHTNTEMH